ncbi:MAG: NAD-dependent epimerase/dehydratase family protein [Actinomycetota bacterium]
MRVLVTGGAGFIGSHVVDQLLAEGHEVVVIDVLLPQAHGGKPAYLSEEATFVQIDLRDRVSLEGLVRGVDAVSHQAAMVGLGESFADVTEYVSHNDMGTATLLAALHATHFSGRLVVASSMVVYGEGLYRCERHGGLRPGPRAPEALERGRFDPSCPRCGRTLVAQPTTEDLALDPRNVYAATKVHQEHLAQSFGRETTASVAALRYHNVYGPRMPRDTPYAGVASVFRSSLERGEAPRVFEDGRQLRDFVHVRDVARANLIALEARDARGCFNIASGEPHSIIEMARTLTTALDGATAPEVTGRYRLADVRHVVGSPARAERELGWKAEVGWAEGMLDFAQRPLRASATQVTDVG